MALLSNFLLPNCFYFFTIYLSLELSMLIDNQWRDSLFFFYQISICLYFFTVDFHPSPYPTHLKQAQSFESQTGHFISIMKKWVFLWLYRINAVRYFQNQIEYQKSQKCVPKQLGPQTDNVVSVLPNLTQRFKRFVTAS